MNRAMDELLNNSTLIAAILSWLLAQFIKFALGVVLLGEIDLTRLTKSGGMPSGHAALVTAAAYGIGREYGFYSGNFALAAVIAIIVMYDATGVRQAVGIQARMLNEIIHDLYRGSSVAPVKIREILGHTSLEVLAGALLGLAIAIII